MKNLKIYFLLVLGIFAVSFIFVNESNAQTIQNQQINSKDEKNHQADKDYIAIVKVEVLIDEKGNVVKAKAKSGDKKYRKRSEEAALKSKFEPTVIDGIPYKIKGTIIYKFSKCDDIETSSQQSIPKP